MFCSSRSEIATNKISPPDIAMYTIRYARRARHRPTLSLPFFSPPQIKHATKKIHLFTSVVALLCVFFDLRCLALIFSQVSPLSLAILLLFFAKLSANIRGGGREGITTGGKESVSSRLSPAGVGTKGGGGEFFANYFSRFREKGKRGR